LSGPDPETDGLVRWRCVDVQRFIAETYKVHYHVRSIGKRLHPAHPHRA
jgi:Winged helix-turn helix